jgi:hypothetical protein
VGAGGKKTACYTLASRLGGAVVTATVRISVFDDRVARVEVTKDPVGAVESAGARDWPLGLVPDRHDEVRYGSYETEIVADLADRTETPILVKADGARNRLFNAPGTTNRRSRRTPTLCSPSRVPASSASHSPRSSSTGPSGWPTSLTSTSGTRYAHRTSARPG